MTARIYTSVYSGVPVYEFMCRGIAVMRRREDSYLNATQILKVAGIEKGKRTKILEREILPGEHEKIQGGYGKYQGTWVPFQRGKDLAIEYKVEPYLRALFDYDISGEVDNITPTKEMMARKVKEDAKTAKGSSTPHQSPSSKRARSSSAKPARSRPSSMTPSPMHSSFNACTPSMSASSLWPTDQPPRKRTKAGSPQEHGQDLSTEGYPVEGDMLPYEDEGRAWSGNGREHMTEEPLEGVEKYRSILMAIFLNDEQQEIPPLLTDPTIPQDLDIDLVIDDQGHTAMHWAAALARIPVLELLVQKQADIRRVNYSGESALVRAILVTNNFDKQSFSRLLSILHRAIPIADRKNRTLLHHIAITAGLRGRGASAHYYMECILEFIAQNGGDFSSLIDIQDKNGDTALTIAARIGDRYLSKFLIDVGANRDIENKVGLKAEDFGIEDVDSGPTIQPFMPRTFTPASAPEPSQESQGGKHGKEVMNIVQKMVEDLDVEFAQEILDRQNQLQETRSLLRQATRDLTETRKTVLQCRAQAQQLEETQQKIKNLEMSLEEESQKTLNHKGYTGKLRTSDDIDLVFNVRSAGAPSSTLGNEDRHALDLERERRAEQEVIQLRSRIYAYRKNDEELSRELLETRNRTSANELQCKKVIAICCKIPLEKVDDMLVPLTLAVESDGASLDLTLVAGLMSRVKQQEALSLTAPDDADPAST